MCFFKDVLTRCIQNYKKNCEQCSRLETPTSPFDNMQQFGTKSKIGIMGISNKDSANVSKFHSVV